MSSQPLILSLETATLAGSFAILRGNEIIAVSEGDPTVSHSNTLLSDVDRLLSQAGVRLAEVELFTVASGPGSFTGLRIGIATVKALATTLNRSCIGVPTLEAIAHSAGPSDLTVAMLPAGRGEVFAQSFSVSHDGHIVELDPASHLSPRTAIERYAFERNICWAGEGALIHANLIRGFAAALGTPLLETETQLDVGAKVSWSIAPKPLNLAQHVASLARVRMEQGNVQSPSLLQALYVRPSDAELKL